MSRKWNFKDYQRDNVYQAESDWGAQNGQQLSNAQSRRLVQAISKHYKLKPIKAFVKAKNRHVEISGIATGRSEFVRLPYWAMTTSTICHEMAHVITQQRGIFDGHGPIFAGFLVELTHKFMGRTEGTDLQWNLLLNSVEVEYNNI